MASFNFNYNTITRFTDPSVENEVQLTTNPVGGKWHVVCDVTLRCYTPNGANGLYAFCELDARPSFLTLGEWNTGLVNDTNPNGAGRQVRNQNMVVDFDFTTLGPQTFWFLVNIGASGPTSWVELRSINGTATEVL